MRFLLFDRITHIEPRRRIEGVKCTTLPGLPELITGEVTVSALREVRVEDVLGRAPVEIDFPRAARYLNGKAVLVTGAGGSIGSELCRQIVSVGARRLVMSLPDAGYERALDVGCGTGFSSLAMVERFGCRELVGVDPAQGMLDQFAEKIRDRDDTRFHLLAEDVEVLVEAAEGFQRNDHEARRDRPVHRETAQQHQRGNDQEAAADADEPGDDPDGQAVNRDLPQGAWDVLRIREPDGPQHQVGCEQHDDRK